MDSVLGFILIVVGVAVILWGWATDNRARVILGVLCLIAGGARCGTAEAQALVGHSAQ